jgi:hypothetical protein
MSVREISRSSIRNFGFSMGHEKVSRYLRKYGVKIRDRQDPIYKEKRRKNKYTHF